MRQLAKKSVAAIIIAAWLISPVVASAQYFDNETGIWHWGSYDDGQMSWGDFSNAISGQSAGGNNISWDDFANAISGRSGGGNILQQVLGDQVKCQAEAPQAQSVNSNLAQGAIQGITNATQQALTQNLGGQLAGRVTADLPQRISNNVQNQLGAVFEQNLRQFLSSGNVTSLSENDVRQLLEDSLIDVIENSIMGSVLNSLPGAISGSLEEGLLQFLPDSLAESLEGALSGPLRNAILGSLGGQSGVGSQLIDQVVGNLTGRLTDLVMTELEGSLNDITRSITDGIMDGIEGSLGEILNGASGAIDEVINGVTGPINSIIGSLTGSIDDITGILTGSIDDLVNSITGPLQNLSGQLSGSLNNLSQQLTQAISNPINAVVESITGSFNDIAQNLTSAITKPINQLVDQFSGQINGLVDQAIKPITDAIGGLTNIPGNILNNVTGGILGGTFLGGLLADSVPVHETGDLLDVTKDIKEIEEESRDVLIEICGHIKDIRRIQLAMEQKEFAQDLQARQQASQLLEDWARQHFEFISRGYNVDGNETKDTLVIENTGEYLTDARIEAVNIYLSEYQNSSDIFKDTTKELLLRAEESYKSYPASTITKEEYETINNPNNDLNSEEYLNLLVKLYDSTVPNNPITSYFINKNIVQIAKDIAEKDRVNEFSSLGFKPVRECEEVASDGQTCLKWKTITPASIVKDSTATVYDTRVRQLESADEVTDVTDQTQTPTPVQLERFAPVDSQAGNSSSFNASFLQNAFSSLLGQLTGLFGNLGGNLGGGGGSGGSGNELEVNFSFTSASITQINGGQANQAFLNWQTKNASRCVAANDWLSLDATGERLVVARSRAQSVGTRGNITLRYPLRLKLRLERERAGQITVMPIAMSTNYALTQQVATIVLESAEVAAGDKFRLVSQTSDEARLVEVTAGSASGSSVISALQAAINGLDSSSDAGREFGRYRLTFGANQAGAGFVTATIDAVYRLTCEGTAGRTATETVTITR